MQQTVKMSFKGNASRKWANGQNIYGSENKFDLRGSPVPAMKLYTCTSDQNSQTSPTQISGKRLHDHWSSGIGLKYHVFLFVQ